MQLTKRRIGADSPGMWVQKKYRRGHVLVKVMGRAVRWHEMRNPPLVLTTSAGRGPEYTSTCQKVVVWIPTQLRVDEGVPTCSVVMKIG